MKKFVKYIVLAVATMFAVGCTPDYPTLDESQLPLASELDVEIVVDQTTNMVTFTLKNQGMTPMWIFPETDRPDDNATKKSYSVAINGYTARFRDAGTHTVEVKAYNANGVSQGSINKEFTLENTYRDPFDQSKYLNAIAGEWMWNSAVDNHFGCGETVDNPTGWWPCPANGKDGMGLYDDRMTFTADGQFTFNPGEGGTVYVNWGTNEMFPDQWDGTETDYQVPMEEHTSGFHFENNWNDAGIEEIYLVLEEGTNLSYIPHVEALSNPRYLVVENTPAQMRKKLNLVWYTPTGNGGGPIAWKYEFVPAVKVVTPEEMLAGTDAAGKVWVMDSEAQGHLGCGETVDNAAGWWSAGPNEKADFGMYDDEITFCPDGKYFFSPGADGKVYINKGVTAATGIAGITEGLADDYDIAWATQEATYEFDGTDIVLPEGVIMGYIPSDLVYTTPVFHVTELTETHMTLVAENPGCYWQYKFRARDYKAPEATIGGVAVEGGKVELSIAQGDVLAVTGIDLSTMWIDPDFFELKDATSLKFLAVDGEYRIQKFDNWLKVVPLESDDVATYQNGGAIWVIGDGGGKPEGSTIGWATGEAPLPLARISENEYRITLWMKAEGGSVKLYERPEWGDDNTGEFLWLQNRYGTITDNGYFNIPETSGNIQTMEGTTAGFYTFFFTDNDGILDMSVEQYVPKAPKPSELDPNSADNLWNYNNCTLSYYFADNSWAQIANPEVEQDGGKYTITLTEGMGASQWQGQFAIISDITTKEGVEYGFQVKLYSEVDQPSVTIKLCNEHESGGEGDEPFFCDAKHSLTAFEEYKYVIFFDGQVCDPLKLVLDFGGCVGGSDVEVYDIALVEFTE